MTITLTENAAKQIQRQLLKRGKGLALRVGIKKAGCSGFAYTFDFADDIGANDQLFESCGANVIVNTDILPFLDGSKIDFVKDGLNSTFKFSNPNVDNTCGCGTSYSFKDA